MSVVSSVKMPYPAFPGARCCDHCQPELFPVETVALTGDHRLKTGRQVKGSPELEAAVRSKLFALRRTISRRDYPGQFIITGKALIQDDVINKFSVRARAVTSLSIIHQLVYWHGAPKYADELIAAIQEVLRTGACIPSPTDSH